MTDPVTIARSWIDTPYRHQQSLRGVGTDCLGLVRGVWRELYGGCEPEAVPSYSPMWGEVGDTEPMLDAAARHLVRIDTIEPGAVLVFRMRHGFVAKHCGIVTDVAHMVHAYQSVGRVVEGPLDANWKRMIAGIFQWPHLPSRP